MLIFLFQRLTRYLYVKLQQGVARYYYYVVL